MYVTIWHNKFAIFFTFNVEFFVYFEIYWYNNANRNALELLCRLE